MNFKQQNPYKVKYELIAEEIGMISNVGCVVTQDRWEEYFQAQKDYLESLHKKVFSKSFTLLKKIKVRDSK